MHDGSALAGELAHEGERDDGLAAAGAAGDDDGGLAVRVAGAVDGVEDVLVGGALLVEEHELFAVLDLVRGDGEQLARRGGGAAHEQVGGVGAAAGREVLAQVVDEVAAALAVKIAGARSPCRPVEVLREQGCQDAARDSPGTHEPQL